MTASARNLVAGLFVVVALFSFAERVAASPSPKPEKFDSTHYPGGISVANGSGVYCRPAPTAQNSTATVCADLNTSSSTSSATAASSASLPLLLLGVAASLATASLALPSV
ncbi:hypothetical protein ACQY0O_006644 [Thecaphora frezii]